MKSTEFSTVIAAAVASSLTLAAPMAQAGSEAGVEGAQKLQEILFTHPMLAVVADEVGTKTSGMVVKAESDNETAGNGIVEFELSDGREKNVSYVLSDGTITRANEADDNDWGRASAPNYAMM